MNKFKFQQLDVLEVYICTNLVLANLPNSKKYDNELVDSHMHSVVTGYKNRKQFIYYKHTIKLKYSVWQS